MCGLTSSSGELMESDKAHLGLQFRTSRYQAFNCLLRCGMRPQYRGSQGARPGRYMPGLPLCIQDGVDTVVGLVMQHAAIYVELLAARVAWLAQALCGVYAAHQELLKRVDPSSCMQLFS